MCAAGEKTQERDAPHNGKPRVRGVSSPTMAFRTTD